MNKILIFILKIFQIDLNKNKNKTIKRIIRDIDGFNNFDKCIMTKKYILKNYRNTNNQFNNIIIKTESYILTKILFLF